MKNRLDDTWCTMENVLRDNAEMLRLARENNVNYVLIENLYEVDVDF